MGPEHLSDPALRERLRAIASAEKEATAELLRHLIELDRRRLCEGWGYPSLFIYCTQELKLSEAASYKRITAARAARAHPAILESLTDGSLNLETVLILHPHLNEDTSGYLLDKAKGMSTRQVQVLVSEFAPRPDVGDFVMRLPDAAPPPPGAPQAPASIVPNAPVVPATPIPRERIDPLSPGRFHIGFTAPAALWRKLERAKDLLRHKYPKGRLEDIVDTLAEAFLDDFDPQRRAARSEGRHTVKTESRAVPKAVRDLVWQRDEGRCSFTSIDGRRCQEHGMLEFDHIIPWAFGGRSDDPANIRLLCRAHNQHAARELFGDDAVGPRRKKGGGRN